MNEEAIKSSIKSLQYIYAVVIALSIAEAFKQFVLPPNEKNGIQKSGIQWDRLPSLFCLLFLVVPFYHGMTRYLYDFYHIADKRPSPYACWLLFDCTVFTVEAGLFFVLSRSLPKELCRRFFWTVMVLLLVDIIWGVVVWRFRINVISSWVIVNVVTFSLLWLFLSVFRRSRSWWITALLSLMVIARTVVDYWTGRNFYFPN